MPHSTAHVRLGRRPFLVRLAGVAALPLLVAACGGDPEGDIDVTTAPSTPTTPPETPPPTPTEPPGALDPDLHRLVSKEHALPADYVPPGLQPLPGGWLMPEVWGELRADVVEALQPMMSAAWEDGVDLRVRSAYRSYATQQETFAYWVSLLGEAQARRESAEPGHSEHQLGTVADFADPANGWSLVESFADTPSGLWLAEHAWEYGFAMSYPRDGEAITGYIFEPWHFRYIGVEAAAAWHASGLTLIEFLEGLHSTR